MFKLMERSTDMADVTTLNKWGNGQGVLIPKRICEQVGISVSDTLGLSVNDRGEIVLQPQERRYRRRRKVTISDLFAGYAGSYKPTEIDWVAAVGDEVEW
jgi:antitoxin MazE